MARRSKNSGDAAGAILMIIAIAAIAAIVGVIFSTVVFAPAIGITAIVNFIKPLKLGQLWGAVFTSTILITGGLYFAAKKKAVKVYAVSAISIFVILGIYTLFDPENLFYEAVKQMYPFIFKADNN